MKYYLRFSLSICFFSIFIGNTFSQRGYNDAPYKRYEADLATLTSATVTAKSFKQSDLQSEASDQICVTMTATNAACEWTVTEAADGLIVRYSVPDGQTGTLGVYSNGTKVSTLTLTSNWSWEYLSTNGNANNVGVVNTNPKMRFDEVRVKLAIKIPVGGKLKLIRETGSISLDFAELEPVPSALTAPAGAVTYSGSGTLQSFIDANPGKIVFVPTGVYNIATKLWFGNNNTKLKGAGMWYTQLNFTYTTKTEGGLYADALNISISDLYITTVRNSRTDSYKGINGVFTLGSVIENVWVEHFEAGAWIAQYYYSSSLYTDGLIIRNCRFRNNYADGVNLCKGTRNTLVEHCSFRNNGDDDMAIWSADGLECQNNTFQFCTSENCWRASGCAIYGGLNNKAKNLLIKDNLEVGLRVNNCFPGIAFNSSGLHEFTDITIDGCGTFNDLFNKQVGAIDLVSSKVAGTQIKNLKFSKIEIIDSKNDAIYLNKTTGDGFYNVVFENITVNGTGLEYPNNNVTNSTIKRGYGILFGGSPAGNGSYCGITYSNRGGNALSDMDISAKGTMTWTALTGCNTVSKVSEVSEIDKSIFVYDKTIVMSKLQLGEIISVFNMYGAKVYSMKATQEKELITSLKEGVYIVTVNAGNTSRRMKIMLM